MGLFNNNENNKNNKNKNMIKKDDKKIYTIVDFPEEGENSGRFTGTSPKRAATKAFTKLAKLSNLNNSKRQLLVFVIRNLETNKEYQFIGSRVKLAKPRKVVINGKNVIYRYKNIVGKYRPELNKIE